MISIRAGGCVFDCSGPIHQDWIREALREHHKVVFYRRDFSSEDTDALPTHESLHLVSGELTDVLARMRNTISLLVDDLGSFHFNENPLDLLKRYYEALRWDGEAWIRFPASFWVLLEDNHRVSLQDYLSMKFPMLVKRLSPSELGAEFHTASTAPEDWIALKKDRHFPKLFFHLQTRSQGGTASTAPAHAPVLEFIEKSVEKAAA